MTVITSPEERTWICLMMIGAFFKFSVITYNIFEGLNLHQALYRVFCISYLSNPMNYKCSDYEGTEGTEA